MRECDEKLIENDKREEEERKRFWKKRKLLNDEGIMCTFFSQLP